MARNYGVQQHGFFDPDLARRMPQPDEAGELSDDICSGGVIAWVLAGALGFVVAMVVLIVAVLS